MLFNGLDTHKLIISSYHNLKKDGDTIFFIFIKIRQQSYDHIVYSIKSSNCIEKIKFKETLLKVYWPRPMKF